MKNYFNDAENRLIRFFSNGGWDIYDGVPVEHDANLLVTDLTLSVALNSQLDNRRKVLSAWRAKHRVDSILAGIPPDITLMDTLVPWYELEELCNAFGKQGVTKYVVWAVGTKVLHKKRPLLIPILDDAVCKCLFEELAAVSWTDSAGSAFVKYLKVFREHLIRNSASIMSLQKEMEEHGWPVTPVRILELLIWIEYAEGGAEYRQNPE